MEEENLDISISRYCMFFSFYNSIDSFWFVLGVFFLSTEPWWLINLVYIIPELDLGYNLDLTYFYLQMPLL